MFLYNKLAPLLNSQGMSQASTFLIMEMFSLSIQAKTSLHSYLKIDTADSQRRGVLWIVPSLLVQFFSLFLLKHLQLLLKASPV